MMTYESVASLKITRKTTPFGAYVIFITRSSLLDACARASRVCVCVYASFWYVEPAALFIVDDVSLLTNLPDCRT